MEISQQHKIDFAQRLSLHTATLACNDHVHVISGQNVFSTNVTMVGWGLLPHASLPGHPSIFP